METVLPDIREIALTSACGRFIITILLVKLHSAKPVSQKRVLLDSSRRGVFSKNYVQMLQRAIYRHTAYHLHSTSPCYQSIGCGTKPGSNSTGDGPFGSDSPSRPRWT